MNSTASSYMQLSSSTRPASSRPGDQGGLGSNLHLEAPRLRPSSLVPLKLMLRRRHRQAQVVQHDAESDAAVFLAHDAHYLAVEPHCNLLVSTGGQLDHA